MAQERRRSPRQAAILRVIRETDCHPNTEWVFQQLRRQFPRISLATVYRNIGLLRQQGELASIGVVNGQERLDGDLHPHAHFICRRCGTVQDLAEPVPPQALHQAAQEALGGQIQSHQLTFYGLCASCAGTENQ